MNDLIQQILDETDYEANPYIVSLRDGSLSKGDFVETQVQFYFAVAFFSRPMSAVAAKIPSSRLRVEILRNVWEEHGEGEATERHSRTFLMLLDRLAGVTHDDVSHKVLWPEVRCFNTLLTGACVMDEYLVGVSVLGMIERMFADIAAWLGQGIVARGWMTPDQMVHYSVHQELDIKHADDFFNVVRPAWDRSVEDRYYIEQGLRLGAYAFNGLYEGLYRGRARRWDRELVVPHLRA